MRIICTTLFILLLAKAWAVEQERPESNADLRGGKPLLLIEQLDDEEKIELGRSATGDYFMQYSEEEDGHKVKLGRLQAEALDERYSALFLQVQYEMPADPKGCDADWKLILRGEEQRFCPKNEQKHQAIKAFFDELKKIARP